MKNRFHPCDKFSIFNISFDDNGTFQRPWISQSPLSTIFSFDEWTPSHFSEGSHSSGTIVV